MIKVLPDSMFYHPREIGKKAEKIAEKALIELRNEDRIYNFWKKDRNGIDFVIKTVLKNEIKIQIKSSATGALKHFEKYPDIPSILIHCDLKMKPRAIRKAVQYAKNNILDIVRYKEGGIT